MGTPLAYAVVGSGASAVGVLTALIKQPSVTITIFDIGDTVPEPNGPIANIEAARAYYATLYRQLRHVHPRKFPPPKTHLGEQIARSPVGQGLSVFKSSTFGGLTNYWGATLLPFTDRELAGWPITRQQLDPYYRSMAAILGLSARADALNIYFSEDFATLPEIQPTRTLALLDQTINRHPQSDPFRIISRIQPLRGRNPRRFRQPLHLLWRVHGRMRARRGFQFTQRDTALSGPSTREIRQGAGLASEWITGRN